MTNNNNGNAAANGSNNGNNAMAANNSCSSIDAGLSSSIVGGGCNLGINNNESSSKSSSTHHQHMHHHSSATAFSAAAGFWSAAYQGKQEFLHLNVVDLFCPCFWDRNLFFEVRCDLPNFHFCLFYDTRHLFTCLLVFVQFDFVSCPTNFLYRNIRTQLVILLIMLLRLFDYLSFYKTNILKC